jgi:hypothetical protein
MIKLFDYKFLITLGLSLVVYFLYREVDMLNKRVATLEKAAKDPKDSKPKKLIDLPPPPPEESNSLIKNEMVEEYSNEEIEHKENINIYSHDNLETNSNDHDTLMVDSILNMIQAETPIKKDNPSNTHSESSQTKSRTVSPSIEQLSEPTETAETNNNVETSESSLEQSHKSDKSDKLEHNDVSDQEIKLVKKNVVFSIDALNKKRLDELQELANKYSIDINNESGKKKRKADLAQEIFYKQ